MPYRRSIGALALAASLCLSSAGARAFDDNKYPDLSGQWQPLYARAFELVPGGERPTS